MTSTGDSGFEATDAEFQQLLAAARDGSRDAVGRLVEQYRDYLYLIANEQLDPTLRAKAAASDMVQESLMAAQRDMGDFRGESHSQWLAWLRAILINELHRTNRAYRGTAKRQLSRERPLVTDGLSTALPLGIADRANTPGTEAVAQEQASQLAAAISRLPDDYRNVVRLRSWEQLPFEEIAERLGRTAEATRKLWSRAVKQLRKEFESGIEDAG